MLRTFQKQELTELLTTMLQMHHTEAMSLTSKDMEVFIDCQQAAIAVGTSLENTVDNPVELVSLLEEYCTLVYELSQTEDVAENEAGIRKMDSLIEVVKGKVELLPVTYQIAFLPYKAAMWDSLESIYLAAKEDSRCQVLVVPIPYYEFVQQGDDRVGTLCCDADKFPADIPVVDFKTYDLSVERPDVVYIHNPFDDNNKVTSVHSYYYSYELKKYARKVIYSPYYVTSGFVADQYLMMPSNNVVDYILAQSKQAKEYYKHYPFYDKVLPFGSPKLDKAINMSKEKQNIPEEWKAHLGSKKIVMLNTSINCFLNQGEAYLMKLEYIFRWFKNREDVALIWRPHPLLESTLRSLRPDLLEAFLNLRRSFQEESMGIYDTTPDISLTVAISDAYMGETASSVINLFIAAGKPLFILDNTIFEAFSKEWERRLKIQDVERIGEKVYLFTGNMLCVMEEDWENLKLLQMVDQEYPYGIRYSGRIGTADQEIYFNALSSEKFQAYDTNTQKLVTKGYQNDLQGIGAIGVAAYGDKVYYLPQKNGAVVAYDRKKKSFETFSEVIGVLKGDEWNSPYIEVCAWKIYEGVLWMVAEYTNRVAALHLEDGSFEVYSVGESQSFYTGIEVDSNYIWLADSYQDVVLQCDRNLNIVKQFSMPEGWKSWTNSVGRKYSFSLVDMGEHMLVVPVRSNAVICINKKTSKTDRMLTDFLKGMDKPQNGYHPQIHGVFTFAKKWDDKHLAVQRTYGKEVAILDVETGDYKVELPSLSKEDFEWYRKGFDGFCKVSPDSDFSCRESMLFTMEAFVDNLVKDGLQEAMERQKIEMSSMTDNWDGTAGQQVHEFIMSVLQKEVC